ncbi:putative secreted protein (Por secretion system target) [Maribacter vaceletii]|uniref:Putative secreted protein (Por secretion system target) n=1 Tax=Maribacter vaceletii TaxID=1206816 RepID=A0A495ECR3_9FLAO|nr:S8 family serine peptidase [Maribacter vaceletii]RKR14678.1 putative secreted protein (Por secretion system target) [Maribacter vaceletii]
MSNKQPTCLWLFKLAMFFSFILCTVTLSAQNKTQKNKIAKANNSAQLRKTVSKLENQYAKKQQRIKTLAKQNGWKLKEELTDGTFTELLDLGDDGSPIYYTTFSDHVSVTSRANSLYEDGLLQLGITGKGMQVGVWDAGVARKTHTEFDSRVTIADAATEIGKHPTMVMGTLLASGKKTNAKGVAYEATGITSDWSRDKIEVAEAAANGLLLSNHSYGIKTDRVPDWYFGSYLRVTKDWDNIMYNAPYYLMVTAAGNAQKSGNNKQPISGAVGAGYDMLLGFATCKNGITVAAAEAKIKSNGDLTKASVASYSSFGPIDDGRVKPDIAGSGTNVFAAYSTNDTSYNSSTGTSMATPGITGSMLLLQQYHEKLYGSFMKAATLKGLVLHTADDVNEAGPDYQMGWGIMNTKRAAEVLANKEFKSLIKEESLSQGETYSITVTIPEGEELKGEELIASVSWTDPASSFINRDIVNNSQAALVNDLDIRISQNSGVYYPWKLSAANATQAAKKGDNKVDTFERINIDNASGEYTITITHKGELTNASQNFSLIVSGVAVTECSVIAPSNLKIEANEDKASLHWDAIPDGLYEIQYKEVKESSWNTKYTNENIFELSDLEIGASYEMRLRTFCNENIASDYSLVYSFTFNEETTVLDEILETNSVHDLHISIYPNPSTDIIQLHGDKEIDSHFQIISTAGLEVEHGNVPEEGIPVSNLSSGMYILVIDTSKGMSTTKFYKD